jgi:hypothetical protein
MVWVDIFLQPNQIVLVGYSIAMRLALGLISSILFGGGGGGSETHSSSHSETGERYRRWGKILRP